MTPARVQSKGRKERTVGSKRFEVAIGRKARVRTTCRLQVEAREGWGSACVGIGCGSKIDAKEATGGGSKKQRAARGHSCNDGAEGEDQELQGRARGGGSAAPVALQEGDAAAARHEHAALAVAGSLAGAAAVADAERGSKGIDVDPATAAPQEQG